MSTTAYQFWTPRRSEAASLLAAGHTYREVAAAVNVSLKTVYNWMQEAEFAAEVDRLSLMVGISSRAERLRLAMRVVRQKIHEQTGKVVTDRDILDWLKFAQSETDGVKLDLSELAQLAQGDNDMAQLAQPQQLALSASLLALTAEQPDDEQELNDQSCR